MKSITRRLGCALAVFSAAALAIAPSGLAAQPGEPFRVFTAGEAPGATQVKSVLGVVSEHLCRRPWDAAASDAEALAPLEAKARAMGANGLVDVRFDRRRTDLKTPCWQKVTVTGSAVVF